MNLEDFRALVYEKASACHRDLPWRLTVDPYAILVSELMLQQTQVSRVVPKYLAWLVRFPTAAALANAPVDEVLILWSGLGYNRRALALHASARMIVDRFDSVVPQDEESLRSLPGVGKYTAKAVLAFAFNKPTVFLETNIRTVLLKHFYSDADGVGERELEETAALALDSSNPRRWYNALMDYGAEIKRVEGNHSVRAGNYRKQSPFSGSFRSLRGAVLKKLLEKGKVTVSELGQELPFRMDEITRCAEMLAAEGFATYRGESLELPRA